MDIRELLPIGSVVLLKEGKKRLMICGIKQTDQGGTGKEYDYIGVIYPEGHIGAEYMYLFNQDDIRQVFFRGYEDSERSEFIDKLQQLYQRQ